MTGEGNSVQLQLDDSSTGLLHVIAEVKDKREHPMTRYQRFVVEVKQRSLEVEGLEVVCR